jgi:hypothetical protein
MLVNGCSAWEREPGADDELRVVSINSALGAMR